MRKKATIPLLPVIFLLSLLLSCSTEKNYRVLSFFFDGVPPPDSTELVSDTLSASINKRANISTSLADGSDAEFIKVYTIHYPYEEKECNSCHVENSPGEMVMEEPGLCYICHEDFSVKYSSLHGPVAAGYCTECHSAHRSENNYLLLRTGQNICTSCHDLAQSPQNEMHTDLGDTECTLCHNPHGGEDRYLMR